MGARTVRLNIISIHAPRTGSDKRQENDTPDGRISIHAPRTGSDKSLVLLTLDKRHFNPRSPHGERLCWLCWPLWRRLFQSTLPARGATWLLARSAGSADFNPRSPHGERPASRRQSRQRPAISIHAPRTGSDAPARSGRPREPNFNPRSPHGERHWRRSWAT